MPRRGENIYHRKDGRWEGRYIKGREGTRTLFGYVYAKTYREAKEKLSKAIYEGVFRPKRNEKGGHRGSIYPSMPALFIPPLKLSFNSANLSRNLYIAFL